MGKKVVVSFIGRAQDRGAAGDAGRSGYSAATYRFDRDERIRTTLFGWALWQYLGRKGLHPDKWLILGTAGSGWDALLDAFWDRHPSDEAFSEVAPWFDRIKPRVLGGTVSPGDLSAAPAGLADVLGVKALRLELIGDCREREEQYELMNVLMRHTGQDDEIILDITHSYRHLPVLASFMLMPLQWLRNARVTGIYYGAFDMRTGDGLVPVVDLSLSGHYAQTSAACAAYRLTGDYRSLAALYPRAQPEIERASFLEEINQMAKAQGPAGQARKNLESETSPDPLRNAVKEELRDAFAWSQTPGGLERRLFKKVEDLVARGERLRPILLLCELVMVHIAMVHCGCRDWTAYNERMRDRVKDQLDKLNPADRRAWERLRDARNALAHMTVSGNADARQALNDEQSFNAFAAASMALVKRVMDDEIQELRPGT